MNVRVIGLCLPLLGLVLACPAAAQTEQRPDTPAPTEVAEEAPEALVPADEAEGAEDTPAPTEPEPVTEVSAESEAMVTAVAAPPGLYHPAGPGVWNWALGLGANVDVLPTALVESEARILPRIHAAFRYGLPAGFTLDVALDAVVLTNELRLGATWAIDVGPVTLGISERLGLVFGHMPITGFDTTVVGMAHYPGMSVGVGFGEHLFSTGVEFLLAHAHYVRFGEASMGQRRTVFHGYAIRIMLESALGSGRIFYGATIYKASPDYQLWLAFSDSNQKLEFVRFKVGYAF